MHHPLAGAPVPAKRCPEKRQLSYTQLNMFLRCPRQYEYRYVHGLKVPPSGAMVQSRVWHQTVEFNYRQKIHSDRDLALGEILRQLVQQVAAQFADIAERRGFAGADLVPEALVRPVLDRLSAAYRGRRVEGM